MCTELLVIMHRRLSCCFRRSRVRNHAQLETNLTEGRTGGIVDLIMEDTFRQELCYRGLF